MMSDLRTNPFQHYPPFLSRQPRIVRLYVFHCLVGFALSAAFTFTILWSDTANIGHLVHHVDGGWLAALVFFVLNGIVFAGVQTAIVIMTLNEPPSDGGRKHPRTPRPDALPVRIRR